MKKNDSALNVISKMVNDSNKVIALYNYGKEWENTNTDTAKKYFLQAKELAANQGNLKLEASYHRYLIPLLNNEGRYAEALQSCFESEQIFKKYTADKKDLAMLYNNFGNEWQYLGDFKNAADHYFIALGIAKDIANLKFECIYLNNLASLYEEMGDSKKLLQYAKEAKVIALQINDSGRLFSTAYNLTEAFLGNDSVKQALVEIKYIEKIIYQANDPEYILDLLILKADYALKINNNKDASLYLLKVLEICSKNENKEYELAAVKGLTDIYKQAGKLSLAQEYIYKAIDVAKEIEALKLQSDCLLIAADIEERLGNIAKALSLRKGYEAITDSLSITESKKNIQLLDIKFDTQKKQSQISQLEKEKQIQAITIKQKNTFNALLGIALLALGLIGFLFYTNSKRKQQLATQTHLIQQQEIKQLQQEKQIVATNSIIQAQEAERNRMAKDLHDGLGGMLSGIKLNLSSMQGNMVIHEKDVQLFSKSITQLDNAITEMRRVAHNMMPEALLKFGLAEAVQDYCDSINESNAVRMQFVQLGTTEPLEKSTEVVLYRIIQELTNNAMKHAAAKNILVQMDQHEKGITLTVEDDGKGFDTTAVSKGAGLQNVQSRVDYLKGNIQIKSGDGNGTSVNIEIPV